MRSILSLVIQKQPDPAAIKAYFNSDSLDQSHALQAAQHFFDQLDDGTSALPLLLYKLKCVSLVYSDDHEVKVLSFNDTHYEQEDILKDIFFFFEKSDHCVVWDAPDVMNLLDQLSLKYSLELLGKTAQFLSGNNVTDMQEKLHCQSVNLGQAFRVFRQCNLPDYDQKIPNITQKHVLSLYFLYLADLKRTTRVTHQNIKKRVELLEHCIESDGLDDEWIRICRNSLLGNEIASSSV